MWRSCEVGSGRSVSLRLVEQIGAADGAAKRKRICHLVVHLRITVSDRGARSGTQAELLLGKALNLEDVAGNLKDAIATYEQVLKAPEATRSQKARAQFRIGACYERLGVDGARKAYEAVVANYGDMTDFATQAKMRLTALGGGAASAAAGGSGPSTRMLWSKVDWWGARVSPNGKGVAFVDMATANLWVREVATGTDRNLTNTPRERAWVDFPVNFSWSHDGTRLAYDWFADGGEVTEIRVVDVRTGAIAKFEATRTVNTGRSRSRSDRRPRAHPVGSPALRNRRPGRRLVAGDRGSRRRQDAQQEDDRRPRWFGRILDGFLFT